MWSELLAPTYLESLHEPFKPSFNLGMLRERYELRQTFKAMRIWLVWKQETIHHCAPYWNSLGESIREVLDSEVSILRAIYTLSLHIRFPLLVESTRTQLLAFNQSSLRRTFDKMREKVSRFTYPPDLPTISSTPKFKRRKLHAQTP